MILNMWKWEGLGDRLYYIIKKVALIVLNEFEIISLLIRIGFNADPDPAFFVNVDPDQIQGFEDQKKEKIYRWKKIIFFNKKLQFSYP